MGRLASDRDRVIERVRVDHHVAVDVGVASFSSLTDPLLTALATGSNGAPDSSAPRCASEPI